MTTAAGHAVLAMMLRSSGQVKPPQDHLATLSHHAASGFIFASTIDDRVYTHPLPVCDWFTVSVSTNATRSWCTPPIATTTVILAFATELNFLVASLFRLSLGFFVIIVFVLLLLSNFFIIYYFILLQRLGSGVSTFGRDYYRIDQTNTFFVFFFFDLQRLTWDSSFLFFLCFSERACLGRIVLLKITTKVHQTGLSWDQKNAFKTPGETGWFYTRAMGAYTKDLKQYKWIFRADGFLMQFPLFLNLFILFPFPTSLWKTLFGFDRRKKYHV